MNNKNTILDTPRLSLTEQVTNTFRSVMNQTEGERTKARVRTVIAGAFMIAAGTMTVGGAIRHSHDNQKIASLGNTIAERDLRLAQVNIQHLGYQLDHIGSASRETDSAIPASLIQLTELQRQLNTIESPLNVLVAHIGLANNNLHKSSLQVQGQLIALRLRMETLKGELTYDLLRLSQTAQTRTRLLHTDPITVAITDIQERALPCEHDSIQSACNGPLHAISCYAFLPGTNNRSNCEAIKPICTRCNLR